MQTFGARAGRARISAMRTSNGRALEVSAVGSSLSLWSWQERFGLDGSFWKMCRDSSRRTTAPRLSQLSTKWKKTGIWGGGLRATLSTSVCPKTDSALSLSQVLDSTVPMKSLLTAAACSGIIRREEKNGRQVPPRLRTALEQTIRLWCNVGAASGTPKDRIFAPRYAPKLESIKAAIRTDQYFVARNLTWNECEQLMGFPAGWTVVGDD